MLVVGCCLKQPERLLSCNLAFVILHVICELFVYSEVILFLIAVNLMLTDISRMTILFFSQNRMMETSRKSNERILFGLL